MEQKTSFLLYFATFLQFICLCYGCQIEGITNWLVPVEERVIDTHDGTFFDRSTSNISGISNIVYRDGLNRGPYLDVTFRDSHFRVGTNNAFKEYEEYETSSSMGVTITFSCTGGSTSVLVMVINVIDTNNNAPRFLPTNNYEFSVIPPLPPGFMVTGCENQIVVRDIDLTTQRINFTIEDNPYFEIFYDTSSTPKEFNAILRAKTFIRSITEAHNFTISATDVDETNDPPLTETATIRIVGDEQFQLPDELVFSRTFYIIYYTSEHTLVSDEIIYLSQGFDDEVKFTFEGQYSTYFDIRTNGNEITFEVKSPLTSEILRENQIYLVIRGQRQYTTGTSATVIIKLPTDTLIVPDVTFDKVLYTGRLENNVVTHEVITVLQYSGDIRVSGDYGEFFTASLSNGSVSVQATATILTTNLYYIALKLHAANATAVLLLNIVETDSPVPPSLSFSSPSYIVRTDEAHTGFIGQVAAIADNGEAVTYSLEIENAHLRQHLSINNDGMIHTSEPTDVGTYTFSVVATTVFSRVSTSAIVHLLVEESILCNDTINLPPLLIIERYEEEPHSSLVPLDRDRFPNCQYQLINKWPIDQPWLFVDENGLHAQSIDREHESIAFMHVSQVQVELNLYCDTELRSKRSLGLDDQTNDLKSYNYGSNNWILTDSILYNPRRSLVNLIVLDINDNAPIFEGKESEPMTVGYPQGDLEEVVLPRALAELKATDADIGENAELLYWSSDNRIVVSPTTGSVHVRNQAILEDNTRIFVNATDRSGNGLTGSLELLVKLLNTNHIAVITVRNAFVDDETQILEDLGLAVGYEIKTLRTTVVPEKIEERTRHNGHVHMIPGDLEGLLIGERKKNARKGRQVDTTGTSLRLYIYGVRDSEPIDVVQLTRDLNNNNIVTVILAQVLSLEDHLEGLQICPVLEREIGLLAATIALAALLFILIVTVAVWFYLKWKKKPTYDQFSDQNSLASRNESIETVKPENMIVPRINIDDLKNNEKNLQDILDASEEVVNEVIVEPMVASAQAPPKTVSYELPNDTIVNISTTDPTGPIVIQSIDKLKDNTDEPEDDDEFGERQRTRRKSVVTFNENVETIIHLEDRHDEESESDVEVYEF